VNRGRLCVVVLTFNSATVIGRTLGAARELGGAVVAVDSGSTDGTRDILARLGCEVHERAFVNYADQRNWAIDLVGPRFEWQLHLDADEVLDRVLISQIAGVVASGKGGFGYVMHRRTHFLGRRLRFGGASNWHLRLFQAGTARCEDRLYDQHFVTALPTRILRGWLDDLNVRDPGEWTVRHNRWSSLEATEIHARSGTDHGPRVAGRLSGDPRERRRLYKGLYYRFPRQWRAALLFCYRYFVQLGFLDGEAGFVYAFLWAFWFRALVDAKVAELERQASRPDP